MLEFKNKNKIFLYKVTKHKKNYMEGLNSKNKNIKDGGSPEEQLYMSFAFFNKVIICKSVENKDMIKIDLFLN